MRIALIFLLTVLFGCASLPTPEEEAMALPQPTPMDYVQDVMKNCAEVHNAFETGESPVDCHVRFPQTLTLSFPSEHYHDQRLNTARQFYGNWCRSVTRATGKAPQFVRIFRREQSQRSFSCEIASGGDPL